MALSSILKESIKEVLANEIATSKINTIINEIESLYFKKKGKPNTPSSDSSSSIVTESVAKQTTDRNDHSYAYSAMSRIISNKGDRGAGLAGVVDSSLNQAPTNLFQTPIAQDSAASRMASILK